jgi:hypothetical protein
VKSIQSEDSSLPEASAKTVRAIIESQARPFLATVTVDSEDDAWEVVITIAVRERTTET